MAGKELTGRKVLAITLGFFGVVLATNLTGAWFAVRTFPGLEVKNTYVASQNFDDELAANARLGWQVEGAYSDGAVILTILDAEGRPAPVAGIDAFIGRATHANDDVQLEFAQGESPYRMAIPLEGGKWELRLKATAPDGTVFRQRHEIIVRP